MDERKLIKSGPGSYVVTLPINWIRRNNLKKGSFLQTKVMSNNTVIINSEAKKIKEENREITINCDYLNQENEISDMIVSSYINNVNSINFINIKESQIITIKKFINLLVGLEIIHEKSNNILVEDILDLKKISLKNTIQRIDLMIKSIFTDLKKSFIDQKLTTYIKSIGLKITFQCLFVRKILNISLRDPNVLQIINFSIEDVMDNMKLVIEFENIDNSLKKIKNLILKTNKNKKILNSLNLLIENYNISIKAFRNYDRKISSFVFKNRKKIIDSIKEIIFKNKIENNLNIYNEFMIIEKASRSIARIAYDRWKD